MAKNPETETLLIESGDGKLRAVVFDKVTHLVVRSLVVCQPVEHGWEIENPQDAQRVVDIPIRGTGECWNANDDPLPPAA